MLARTVENVYWLARYLERAEDTARLINVNTHLLLDLPSGAAPGWLPLVDITGCRTLFDDRYPSPDPHTEERDVVQFLVADRDNPGSIASSLHLARENARVLRDVLPSESWEELNRFFQRFYADLPRGLSRRARFDFLKRGILMSQVLTGMLEGTMSRNDAYTFMMLGRHLERADMTSRILDVRCAKLLPAEAAELATFDIVQWVSVLRSLSGYEMYRLSRRSGLKRTDLLQFLLRDEQFPRACLMCLRQMQLCLQTLPRNTTVSNVLAAARQQLIDSEFELLDRLALHEFIDLLQLRLTDVHAAIADTYFPGQGDGSTLERWSSRSAAGAMALYQ